MSDVARPVFGEDGHEQGASVAKLPTGIPGFDDVTMGGLPARRTTVLVGQAGSAKTVFAGQFLAEGVRQGQGAVFVTLEEPATDLRLNLTTLGCDIAGWEASGDWPFVDASPVVNLDSADGPEILPTDLDTLAAQIGHAVDRTAAQRVVARSRCSRCAAPCTTRVRSPSRCCPVRASSCSQCLAGTSRRRVLISGSPRATPASTR